jgi:hypothetical protein
MDRALVEAARDRDWEAKADLLPDAMRIAEPEVRALMRSTGHPRSATRLALGSGDSADRIRAPSAPL